MTIQAVDSAWLQLRPGAAPRRRLVRLRNPVSASAQYAAVSGALRCPSRSPARTSSSAPGSRQTDQKSSLGPRHLGQPGRASLPMTAMTHSTSENARGTPDLWELTVPFAALRKRTIQFLVRLGTSGGPVTSDALMPSRSSICRQIEDAAITASSWRLSTARTKESCLS